MYALLISYTKYVLYVKIFYHAKNSQFIYCFCLFIVLGVKETHSILGKFIANEPTPGPPSSCIWKCSPDFTEHTHIRLAFKVKGQSSKEMRIQSLGTQGELWGLKEHYEDSREIMSVSFLELHSVYCLQFEPPRCVYLDFKKAQSKNLK